MTKIYSYVLRFDDGSAPNPFGGICTLTICKPVIRRTAQIGDWVIGTSSKNAMIEKGKPPLQMADRLLYAMKITDIKTLKEYDEYCKKDLPVKILDKESDDWKIRRGDCIYDFSKAKEPVIREGVHKEGNRKRDLGGVNSLLSDHFYYFGVEAPELSGSLKELIKKNQGHKKIEVPELIEAFETWIAQFEKNKLYADPQLKWTIDNKLSYAELTWCAKEKQETDEDDMEERLC